MPSSAHIEVDAHGHSRLNAPAATSVRDPCPVDCIDLIEIPGEEIPAEFREHSIPCINCGQCNEACPRDLQPQLLYWFRENDEQTNALNLDNCIVCGLCDNVCPSEIPLTHTFRVAKQRKNGGNEKGSAGH